MIYFYFSSSRAKSSFAKGAIRLTLFSITVYFFSRFIISKQHHLKFRQRRGGQDLVGSREANREAEFLNQRLV